MTQYEIDVRTDERQRYTFKVLEALVYAHNPAVGLSVAHRIADRLGMGTVFELALHDYEESGYQWDEVRLLALLNDQLEPGEEWRDIPKPPEDDNV